MLVTTCKNVSVGLPLVVTTCEGRLYICFQFYMCFQFYRCFQFIYVFIIYYSLYFYLSENLYISEKYSSFQVTKFRKSGNPKNPLTAGFPNGFGHNSDAIRQFSTKFARLILKFRGVSCCERQNIS